MEEAAATKKSTRETERESVGTQATFREQRNARVREKEL